MLGYFSKWVEGMANAWMGFDSRALVSTSTSAALTETGLQLSGTQQVRNSLFTKDNTASLLSSDTSLLERADWMETIDASVFNVDINDVPVFNSNDFTETTDVAVPTVFSDAITTYLPPLLLSATHPALSASWMLLRNVLLVSALRTPLEAANTPQGAGAESIVTDYVNPLHQQREGSADGKSFNRAMSVRK